MTRDPRGRDTNVRRRKTDLGKRLTDMRLRLGLSQKEAAQRCGVKVRAYIAWEVGTQEPAASRRILLEMLLAQGAF